VQHSISQVEFEKWDAIHGCSCQLAGDKYLRLVMMHCIQNTRQLSSLIYLVAALTERQVELYHNSNMQEEGRWGLAIGVGTG
jgi:hypothetical protein